MCYKKIGVDLGEAVVCCTRKVQGVGRAEADRIGGLPEYARQTIQCAIREREPVEDIAGGLPDHQFADTCGWGTNRP